MSKGHPDIVKLLLEHMPPILP